MREILFRGKRTNGEWVYGDLTRYSDTMSYITVDLIKNEVYEVATETVGQYTGIKDKNGKKIYEGDILEDSKGIAVVYYTPPAFTAEDKDCEVFALGKGLVEITKLVDTKIIGNITDNKELLGVEILQRQTECRNGNYTIKSTAQKSHSPSPTKRTGVTHEPPTTR